LTVPQHDPVYKVSIIPRGRALGVTMFLPESDRYSYSKRRILSQIASLFGGRIAEEMIFGDDNVTTGASNDIERATELARNMVTKWGLSSKMGPLTYGEEDGEVFLGRSMQQRKEVSDTTNLAIDDEVRSIVDDQYNVAEIILKDKADTLHLMAEALMKYETIDESQIADIMQGKTPQDPPDWDQQVKPSNKTQQSKTSDEQDSKTDASENDEPSTQMNADDAV
jgi:cell division protease FtsH